MVTGQDRLVLDRWSVKGDMSVPDGWDGIRSVEVRMADAAQSGVVPHQAISAISHE